MKLYITLSLPDRLRSQYAKQLEDGILSIPEAEDDLKEAILEEPEILDDAEWEFVP